MKRSRKTLFALLLALVMTLGLAATAWATGEVPTDTNPLEKKLSITKVVEKTGDVTPPAETFTFVLEDAANDEKQPLDYYGIELLDDLKISTTGTGTFEKTFRFKLSALELVQRWNPSPDAGGNEPATRYNKTFILKEQDDNRKAGWQYSDKEYAVTFTYYTREGAMYLTIHDSGADTSHESAEFTNTYTENLTTVEIPFTKTVKLGGNTDPGKTDFELEIFDIGNNNEENKAVTYTAVVTTNGAGSYDGKLVISGPKSQVKDFVSEGFYVREKNNNLSGWTYSDAVWHVQRSGEEDTNGIPKMNIYSTGNGEGAAVEQMTFENTYTYNHTTHARRTPEQPNTPETETAITAPKTFDAGVALYGVSALLSLTGTALVIKRKNG